MENSKQNRHESNQESLAGDKGIDIVVFADTGQQFIQKEENQTENQQFHFYFKHELSTQEIKTYFKQMFWLFLSYGAKLYHTQALYNSQVTKIQRQEISKSFLENCLPNLKRARTQQNHPSIFELIYPFIDYDNTQGNEKFTCSIIKGYLYLLLCIICHTNSFKILDESELEGNISRQKKNQLLRQRPEKFKQLLQSKQILELIKICEIKLETHEESLLNLISRVFIENKLTTWTEIAIILQIFPKAPHNGNTSHIIHLGFKIWCHLTAKQCDYLKQIHLISQDTPINQLCQLQNISPQNIITSNLLASVVMDLDLQFALNLDSILDILWPKMQNGKFQGQFQIQRAKILKYLSQFEDLSIQLTRNNKEYQTFTI